MRRNRSIPPFTVIPVLTYPDVRAAVSWLSGAFGFVERTRVGGSHRAQLSIGTDGAVIVTETNDERQVPIATEPSHLLKIRVDDVDAHYDRARTYGATVLQPPTDQIYGERECTVEDLAGHQWQFSETIADIAPEEYGCETVALWPRG